MERLNIITWVWGDKYGPEYIERLARGVLRNLTIPFKFRVFTPQDEDEYLTKVPGCFARLRTFDLEWQEANDLHGRIVCMDLDSVVTGPLDGLFDNDDLFAILQGANAANPCPYNGSIWSTTAGYRRDVWDDFTLEAAEKVPFHSFPDDQAWLAHKIPGAARWQVGKQSGIYALGKPGWPIKHNNLPDGAKLVVFPGWRDPSKFTHLEWVKKYWA